MKRVIRFNLIILFCFVFFIIGSEAHAKTLKQMKNELAAMKEKYNNNQSSKKMTESQIADVKSDISSINSQIDSINQEISNLNNDIEKRNQDIAKMKEEINSIMHYYQVSSSESFYLEYVFNASDFTDFIYRMAISEQLSEYREKTINEYNDLIKKNREKVSEIAAKKTSLKSLESDLSKKRDKLDAELTGIETAGMSIKDEIADLEKTVNLYQNTYKCSDNEQISTCINRKNNSYGSGSSSSSSRPSNGINVPSSSGFFLPISSWTNIYPFKHHDNGMDLSTPEGQAVHPIADGVVIDIWYRYSCGGNMVWISHNVNGRKYTSAYFHLKSINVSVDQQVSHNTVIGSSGGAKRGTSTNTYDGCTTGPHLHLQVATGHYERYIRWSDGTYHISYSSWNSSSINPANLIF